MYSDVHSLLILLRFIVLTLLSTYLSAFLPEQVRFDMSLRDVLRGHQILASRHVCVPESRPRSQRAILRDTTLILTDPPATLQKCGPNVGFRAPDTNVGQQRQARRAVASVAPTTHNVESVGGERQPVRFASRIVGLYPPGAQPYSPFPHQ